MSQLADLSKPFAGNLVHGNPSGGGNYVKHHVVNQRLLLHVGPFDFELVQIVRGFVAGRAPNPNGNSARAKAGTPDLHDAVVGAVCRLTCTIDGVRVRVEEAGDCEEPNNWPHDGARMKDAMSDAFKRCAMRVGLGLHLWSNEEYFLDRQLDRRESAGSASGEGDGRGPASPSASSNGDGKAGAITDAPAKPLPPVAPQEPIADRQQMKAIFALLRTLNVGEDERREYAGAILDRTVESFTSLSTGEAKRLIEVLGTHVDAQKARTA